MATAIPAPLDPILDAIARAPLVRRLTPEQHAELAQDREAIAMGRARLVAHEDVPAALEEIARSQAT